MEKLQVNSVSKEAGREGGLGEYTYENEKDRAKRHEDKGNSTNNNESGINPIVCCGNKQAEKLALEILYKSKKVEQKTTNYMKMLEGNDVKLEGLDYRLKSIESLTRKILSDSHAEGISLEEAAENISDSLRYTLIISEKNYTSVVEKSLEQLEENGYKINKIKNYWGDDLYQGINASLTTPDGVKMELQFHTEDSYHTKETLNHKYYEIVRSESATTEEIGEAAEKMIYNQSLVKVPPNAENISKEELFNDGKD